jgi:hypothetical protein
VISRGEEKIQLVFVLDYNKHMHGAGLWTRIVVTDSSEAWSGG